MQRCAVRCAAWCAVCVLGAVAGHRGCGEKPTVPRKTNFTTTTPFFPLGFSPGVVTGKPVHLHGSLGREAATGRGTVFATRELLKASGAGGLAGKTVAIQGFGNVGAWAAELFAEEGAVVVAVSDAFSAVRASGENKGLDVAALRAHVAAGGRLEDFSGGTAFPKADILTVPCDVLVPAAIGGVLTAETAPKVDAKFVVEAANGPTTPDGDAVLRDRGIVVLPDIYTNGGGVTVSFFEWVQVSRKKGLGGWVGKLEKKQPHTHPNDQPTSHTTTTTTTEPAKFPLGRSRRQPPPRPRDDRRVCPHLGHCRRQARPPAHGRVCAGAAAGDAGPHPPRV